MRIALKAAALAAAAVMATATTGCAVMKGEQSVKGYADDATLTAEVKAAFARDNTVKATDINVDVNQGRVTLTGAVESEAERTKAASIARQVPGVKSVNSALRVASAGSSSGSSRSADSSGASSSGSSSSGSDTSSSGSTTSGGSGSP